MNLIQTAPEYGAFFGIALFNLLEALLQKPCLRPTGQAALILPVVQTFVVAQQKIHVRSVIRQRIFHKRMLFQRMGQAAFLPALLLRLVKGREQHVEKHRVIAQGHPAESAIAAAQIAAQAAVVSPVAFPSLLGHFRRSGHVAEHQRFSS